MAKKIDMVKEHKNLKQPALSGLSPKMSQRVREHSKSHEGGMASKHIQNILRFLRSGNSFKVAHEKAVKLDKKESDKKKPSISLNKSYGY